MPEDREDRPSDPYAEGPGDSIQVAQDSDLRSVMAVCSGMVVKMRQAGHSSPQFVRTRRSKSSSFNAARSSASGPWPCSSVSIEAATSPGVPDRDPVSSRGPKAHS